MGGSCFILSSCRPSILLLLLYCAPCSGEISVGVNGGECGAVDGVSRHGEQIGSMYRKGVDAEVLQPNGVPRFGGLIEKPHAQLWKPVADHGEDTAAINHELAQSNTPGGNPAVSMSHASLSSFHRPKPRAPATYK